MNVAKYGINHFLIMSFHSHTHLYTILHASGLQLALRARKTRRAMRMGRRWRRVPRCGLSLTTWGFRCDL